ncbi:hypothetical protein [Nostoc sp. 2RC]|uniref:hypothetical protein n=1 Tax=Nostoc sp. 2RC TaxID=2485484 RepID=UPI00162536AB|nr:hypothetical protein [Nostoc sp. 2RC]MBC1235924.1 hypothetical protein [Nostoc sp. 2RC]
MRTSYIEYATGMFLQSLEHCTEQAVNALDNIYLDPWTNCKWKTRLYKILVKTEEEVVKRLEDSKSNEENPQEVVKSLGDKLMKESRTYAYSTAFANPFTEAPYIKVQVETYYKLANILFLISTIDTENIINLGQ